VYFDNDVKVHAPYDAAALAARLGLPRTLPQRASTQPRRRRPAEAVRGAWAAPR
jgi:uncharacterized protein YecE (DUF72 family)